METTTLYVSTTLDASPPDVYRALTDDVLHSRFTGAPSSMDAMEGGEYSYFDGLITGTFLELEAPRTITQKLRARGWPEGHHAEVWTELVTGPEESGTLIKVRETGVPAAALDEVTEGWSRYWSALARYLDHRKKEVIRRLYGEVMAKGNMAVANEIFSPDYVDHMPIMRTPDRAGLLASVDAARRAFPDVKPRILAEISEGDWVAIAVAADGGTHQDAYMGVPRTDRPVNWTETHFWKVVGGRIVEHYGNVSMFEIHKMIGSHDLTGTLA